MYILLYKYDNMLYIMCLCSNADYSLPFLKQEKDQQEQKYTELYIQYVTINQLLL